MAGATYRGIATVWLLMAAVACGRSEVEGDEISENGGAGDRAGGSSTSGRSGGVSGSSGVAGGANSGGAGSANGSGGIGGAGGSGASGQVGNSGTSGSGIENCTNGVDDDRDGNIDCADIDCIVGYSCAPPAPGGGWVGPISHWYGSGPPPACTTANGFPTEVTNAGTEISETASTICPSCACGKPQGVACEVATATFSSNGSCSGNSGSITFVQGACSAFVSTLAPAGVRWESAPPTGGVCIPKASASAVFPPARWDTRMRACGDPPLDGGGCGAGSCVARQKEPFSKQLCIYQPGNLACPAGSYSNRYVYFAGVDDTRACSECTCTPPSATSCSGNIKLYTDRDCTDDETTLSNVLQCSALAPDPTPPPEPYVDSRSVRYSATADATGNCTPRPSTASGSVSPSDPITLCCISP